MEFRDRFDKFTERARKVLTLAREEAQSQKSKEIETTHILLALVKEGEGVASKVLKNLGVEFESLRETLAKQQAQKAQEPDSEPTGTLSQEAKQSMQFAVDEARRLNHHYIGTEHLLLGLGRQPNSQAASALKEQNIDLEKIRTVTIQVVSQSGRRTHQAGGRGADTDYSASSSAHDRDRFDKFTERARKVLSLAQEEAQRFQHNYIGTEHLLLGLVREGEGVAAQALSSMGVELKKVRSAVEFIIGHGDRIVLGEIGLTPRAKKVIELGVDEARRLNHHYIGTEHLLLGLVREGEGIAAGVLESLGVRLGALRVAVLKILNQPAAADESIVLEISKEQHIYSDIHSVHHISQQTYDALAFARTERTRLQDPIFGTEHILLGLLYEEQSISAQVLKELGIELAAIYPAIEALQNPEERSYPWSQDFTALSKAMQDLAGHEAMLVKSEVIGTEHLLLALLRYPESNAMKIIRQLGADPMIVHRKVIEKI